MFDKGESKGEKARPLISGTHAVDDDPGLFSSPSASLLSLWMEEAGLDTFLTSSHLTMHWGSIMEAVSLGSGSMPRLRPSSSSSASSMSAASLILT